MYAQLIVFSYFNQKKALSLIHFKESNAHITPLFFKSKMVKLPHKIKILNFIQNLSANMSAKNYLPSLITVFYFPPLLITMKLHLQPKVI